MYATVHETLYIIIIDHHRCCCSTSRHSRSVASFNRSVRFDDLSLWPHSSGDGDKTKQTSIFRVLPNCRLPGVANHVPNLHEDTQGTWPTNRPPHVLRIVPGHSTPTSRVIDQCCVYSTLATTSHRTTTCRQRRHSRTFHPLAVVIYCIIITFALPCHAPRLVKVPAQMHSTIAERARAQRPRESLLTKPEGEREQPNSTFAACCYVKSYQCTWANNLLSPSLSFSSPQLFCVPQSSIVRFPSTSMRENLFNYHCYCPVSIILPPVLLPIHPLDHIIITIIRERSPDAVQLIAIPRTIALERLTHTR